TPTNTPSRTPTITLTSTVTITPTITGTFTNTPPSSATVPPCGTSANYVIAQSTGASIVSGTTLVPGSQCDDCMSAITLPFGYRQIGRASCRERAKSNGNTQLLKKSDNASNECYPTGTDFSNAIL